MESLKEQVKQALAWCGWNGSRRQEGVEARFLSVSRRPHLCGTVCGMQMNR